MSGRRTSASVPASAPVASKPATVAPDGRPIRSVSEVGKPGTYTEVVVPNRPASRPSVSHPVVRPTASRTKVQTPPALPAVASTYTVASGDSLGHIAQKHGVTRRDLIRLNNLNEPDKLRVGQKLNIPVATKRPSTSSHSSSVAVKAPSGGTTHKVGNGESVSVIAQKYGVKTADVLAANNLTRDSMIRVGQTLAIPGAKSQVASKTDPGKTEPALSKPVGLVPPAPVAPVTPTVSSTTPPAPPVPGVVGIQPIPGPKPVTPPAPVPTPAPTPAPTVGTPTSSTPAPAPAGTGFKSYTVRENEDVYSVAIKWGIAPTELRQINNLTSSELTPGQVLRIPE